MGQLEQDARPQIKERWLTVEVPDARCQVVLELIGVEQLVVVDPSCQAREVETCTGDGHRHSHDQNKGNDEQGSPMAPPTGLGHSHSGTVANG